jgi:hypothetical protein
MCGVICRNIGPRRVGILQTSNVASTATLLASLSVVLKHRNITIKKKNDLELGPGSAGTLDKVTDYVCHVRSYKFQLIVGRNCDHEFTKRMYSRT